MAVNQTVAHIDLLAPVPRVHLESATETDKPDRQTAFGTRDWELFNKLEQYRAGMPADVYIYESHYPQGSFEGKATWHARYVRLEPDRHKAKAYRPKSTETDTFEGEVYWIIEGLGPEGAHPGCGFHRIRQNEAIWQIVSSSSSPSR